MNPFFRLSNYKPVHRFFFRLYVQWDMNRNKRVLANTKTEYINHEKKPLVTVKKTQYSQEGKPCKIVLACNEGVKIKTERKHS